MTEILDNDNNRRKIRKITCEWDEKNTKKLIKCVRNRRVLWDPTHPEYKNRSTREWEWKLIGTDIFYNEHSGGEVCIKWQNLRSQYNNYNKKYKYGRHNNKNIRWKYFNMLHFLSTPDIIPAMFNYEPTIIKSEINIPIEEPKNSDYQENCNISTESEHSNKNTIPDNETTERTPINNITNNNNNNNNTNKLLEFGDTEYLTNSNLKSAISDEYTDFGKFVANELRNLQFATDLQSKLKRQIQRYIVDIADEYASRLNSKRNLKNIKPDSTLESTTSSSSITNTSSSAIEYFTECKVEIED